MKILPLLGIYSPSLFKLYDLLELFHGALLHYHLIKPSFWNYTTVKVLQVLLTSINNFS